MLSLVDQKGLATIAAAEGQVALASGDTPRARKMYAEAGEVLEKQLVNARKESEKHLVRFLAASQYFQGGHYGKALALCQKIHERLLPREIRLLFPQFARDVKSRASAGYQARIRQKMTAIWLRKDYARVLEMLQEHPYVLQPGGLAFLRASICEDLKDYRAAAVFYGTAHRFQPDDPELIFIAAALPLTLPQEGRLDEAWEYVQYQLEMIPHPATYVNASLLCFHRALAAVGENEKRKLYEEQISYFDKAWRTYQELPPKHYNYRDLHSFMALGFEMAAFGLLNMGDGKRAREVCDAAIRFGPNTSNPLTVRGIVTYPDKQAVADFEKAVELGEQSYFPYYFLADHALDHDEFRTALIRSKQALDRKPSPPVQAQLHEWAAICMDYLGAKPEEVDVLFRKAIEIDPTNKVAAHNYQLFVDSLKTRKPRPVHYPDREKSRRWDEEYLFDRETGLSRKRDRKTPVQRELQQA